MPAALIRILIAVALLIPVFAAAENGGLPSESRPPDRVIRLVAERFTFVPSRIKLKLGEVVELRIRSLDTDHGFRLQGTDVNVVIPKRGRGEVRVLFRAQRKGVFPFFCSKACGAGHTIMRGRIIVE